MSIPWTLLIPVIEKIVVSVIGQIGKNSSNPSTRRGRVRRLVKEMFPEISNSKTNFLVELAVFYIKESKAEELDKKEVIEFMTKTLEFIEKEIDKKLI